MAKVEDALEQAEQICLAHGARWTKKRKRVLAGLLVSDKALSAYELVDICHERYDCNIPPMSVYRILEFLEAEGLVHKLNLANKYVACSHIRCGEEHAAPQFLICRECWKVKEVHIQERLVDGLKRGVHDAGFTLISPQIEMSCVCNTCLCTEASTAYSVQN